jgi:hypothetical protein
LKLLSGRALISDLERLGEFEPAPPFYAGHMGKTYDDAMAVVPRDHHYVRLRDAEKYLDPTTEVHESLHGMSSLIRNVRGESIASGYDVIYLGDWQFAEIRLNPGITKAKVRGWLPRQLRSSDLVKTHLYDPGFARGHVAMIVEELAYHVLDARIGLENHRYMAHKLGITNAVTAPAAEWSILALAAATMLEAEPSAFPSAAERQQFMALIKRLVEDAVKVYCRGMDGERYGMLANLAPELRGRFTSPLTEESRQVRDIRGFCSRTYGKGWLGGLLLRVEAARTTTEPSLSPEIYDP